MKRKSIFTRAISMLLCGVILSGILVGCQSDSSETEALSNNSADQTSDISSTANKLEEIDMNVEATRTAYTNLAQSLQAAHEQSPDDVELALAYAEKLLQLGNVNEAETTLDTILASDSENAQAILLRAQVAYLKGDYKKAEAGFETLLNAHPDYIAEAELGLEYTYYQTNQYHKATTLSGEYSSTLSIDDMMKAFGDREPYTVSWEGEEKAVVPFIVTDPLPLVELEINGEKKNFLIDTGASETYLNQSLATAMGIQPISTMTREYAGGISVETSYGILDSMKLGNAVLESVPVNIANLDHFADLYDVELCGVIGVGVFRQFCVSMDYINGELILTPKGMGIQVAADAVEVPFVTAGTHFILSKVMINGKEMNMFLDSGLVADQPLLLPISSMEYADIPLPEMNEADDPVGGLGGADFDMGFFTVNTFEMGTLPTVSNMEGIYGVFPEVYYFDAEMGTFVDGILSHVYLRDFVWTIDFDSMTMTYSK